MAGYRYAREGRSLLPSLDLSPQDRHEAADRLLGRAHQLLRSTLPHRQNVGFLLFGLSEAVRGNRRGH